MKNAIRILFLICFSAMSPLVLTACGFAPHEHDWGEWYLAEVATCQKTGFERRDCKTDANHFETRELDRVEHQYTEWTAIAASTRELPSHRTRECVWCGHEEMECFADETLESSVSKSYYIQNAAQIFWYTFEVQYNTRASFRFYVSNSSNFPADYQLIYVHESEGISYFEDHVSGAVYFEDELPYFGQYFVRLTAHSGDAYTAGTVTYTDLRKEAAEISVDSYSPQISIAAEGKDSKWFKFTLTEDTWVQIDTDAYGSRRAHLLKVGIRSFDGLFYDAFSYGNANGLSLAPEYEVWTQNFGFLPAGTYYVIASKPTGYFPEALVDCRLIIKTASPLIENAEAFEVNTEKEFDCTPGGTWLKITIPETKTYGVSVPWGNYPRFYPADTLQLSKPGAADFAFNFYSEHSTFEIETGEYYVLILGNAYEETGKICIYDLP